MNSGHEGTEQGLSRDCASMTLGQPGSPAGLNLQGGSLNHRALAAASAYLWGNRNPTARRAGRNRLMEFLNSQIRTFMAIGDNSEFETSSHDAWWSTAFAAIWLEASPSRTNDTEVLAIIRRLQIQQRTVELACMAPSGHVVIPGGRSFVGDGKTGDADQRILRDQRRAIIDGRQIHLPAEILDPRTAPTSTDRIGLWLYRQISQSEKDIVTSAPAEMPSMLDALTISRSVTELVSWFEQFRGLRPAYYAWVDFKTGDEKYGTDPTWPKGQPGGVRPQTMIVPIVASPLKVWHLGGLN